MLSRKGSYIPGRQIAGLLAPPVGETSYGRMILCRAQRVLAPVTGADPSLAAETAAARSIPAGADAGEVPVVM